MKLHTAALSVSEFTDHNKNGGERTILYYYTTEDGTLDTLEVPGTDASVEIYKVEVLIGDRKKDVTRFLSAKTGEMLKNQILEKEYE